MLALVVWASAMGLAPLPAAAQSVTGAARVNTYVDACVPIDIEQFHRVLAIELGTSIEYSPGAAKAPDGAMVRVTCNDSGVVLLLDDNLTHKSMQRQVELPQLEVSARTRLLALTVAEFVVASWVELHLAQAPGLPSAGPPLPPAAAQAVKQAVKTHLPEPEPGEGERSRYETTWQLGVSFDPIMFTRGTDYVPQGSLRLEQHPSLHLVINVVLTLGHADWPVSYPSSMLIGRAALTTTSARAGLAYREELGSFDLTAGLGVRVGVVHMAGQTLFPELLGKTRYFPWAGPVLTLGGAVRAGEHVRLLLELEVGYATLAAQAVIRESVIAEFGGLWGALALGAAWSF